jgi:hypothetical protein
MADESNPDLNLLSRQMDRLLTEFGGMRDELRVQGAVTMRLDPAVVRLESYFTTLLEEMRATHMQINRVNDRIRKLEDERA